MTRLPACKPRIVIRALKKAGFLSANHDFFNSLLIISVPAHNRDLKRGTLRNIIKQAGLDREEFLKLL